MKKFIYIFGALLLFIPFHETANAQWSVGVSYEYRNEDPNSGFGLRAEKSILEDLPLLDLSLRGHFSYFNETTQIGREGINFSSDLNVYDFGFAALAGFSIELVSPYVGVGIGNERFKLSTDVQDLSFKERNFYWNGFIGANVEILPYLKPFFEFRAGKLTSTDEVETDNINRIAIGVNVYF
ncbi:MAG: outer membrane beta-barrel protein [Balneolaceae bacterium]|nr:outer membrane beta-barrel protein [Balneolaceae bacterium]